MTELLTRDELDLLDRIAAETIEPCDPPAEVRGRVMEMIRRTPQRDMSVPGEHESRTVRVNEGTWKAMCPGVRSKRLTKDDRRTTYLVEMEPSALLPAHDHEGNEESYVVRGSCSIGGLGLETGDFHQVNGGSRHGDVVASADGCTLLITVWSAAA